MSGAEPEDAPDGVEQGRRLAEGQFTRRHDRRGFHARGDLFQGRPFLGAPHDDDAAAAEADEE